MPNFKGLLNPSGVLFVLLFFSMVCDVRSSNFDQVQPPWPSGGVGVSVVPFVRIPNNPSTGAVPRLNMLREVPDGTGRLFVIDQLGYLYVIQPDQSIGVYLNLAAVIGNSSH